MKKRIADNVIRIPSTLDSIFRQWLEFLEPLHYLTQREIDVSSAFLRERYDLSKSISDSALLDKVVMSEDSKRKIREKCDITLGHFQVIMGKLRKHKIIVGGVLNPKFIPNIIEEDGSFRLMLYFDFKK